jgi:hypothetical protein
MTELHSYVHSPVHFHGMKLSVLARLPFNCCGKALVSDKQKSAMCLEVLPRHPSGQTGVLRETYFRFGILMAALYVKIRSTWVMAPC